MQVIVEQRFKAKAQVEVTCPVVEGIYRHRPDSDLLGDSFDTSQRVNEEVAAQTVPLLRCVHREACQVY